MIENNSLINININETKINFRPNCSTYNPCGSRGDCHDNFHGEWSCDCKFWWKGTSCDTLSSGGNQVVILGVITGLLIILYYSLTLHRWIHKKRKQSPKDTTISPVPVNIHHRSYRHINTVTSSSHKILSWIRAILTILLSISALLIKWNIIKNIHQDIVYKFQHNQTLFYIRPSICRTMYYRDQFNIFTFPIACLLILLFIIVTKRNSTKSNHFCSSYLAIPIPFDFFAHVKRTSTAVIFGIVADELSNIVNQFINSNISSSIVLGDGIILTYLSQILRVLFIGFRFYPILAAIYLNTRLTLICASLYAWLDFSLTIAFKGVCRNDYYSTNDDYNKTSESGTSFYLNYYGTGSKLIIFQLLTDCPRYLFLAYICIQLPILLFKRIREKQISNRRLTREQTNLLYSSLPYSTESKYVENLFGLREKHISTNRLIRFFRYFYEWRDDFRFSSRIICVYASIFFLLFYLTLQASIQVPPYFGESDGTHSNLVNKLLYRKVDDSSSEFLFPNLVRPYLAAIFTALIITLIQLFILLCSIRRNLLQVFRGDNSEIPRRDPSQYVTYANANMHFAGYLIGYVLWGYVLIAFFVAIIAIIIAILFTLGIVGLFEPIVKIAIPPILFALFQNYLNKILGQFIFLQHGGEVLSIKHRRILMIFLYFNFFLDAFLGIISSIIRILKSSIGGFLYMCRLDYSSLGRKLETYDTGFSAYCGFIHMECAHRHPVLLYFTSLLIRQHLYGTEITHFSRARQRWNLAMFLIRNPTLIYRRKQFLIKEQTNETRLMWIARKNIATMCLEEPSDQTDSQSTTV